MSELDQAIRRGMRRGAWLRIREMLFRMVIGIFCVGVWQWGASEGQGKAALCFGSGEVASERQLVELPD